MPSFLPYGILFASLFREIVAKPGTDAIGKMAKDVSLVPPAEEDQR